MKKEIMELVKNEDFASVDEFYKCLSDNKKEVLKHLRWRADGGCMKDENLSRQYIKACNKLIAAIQ